MLPRTLLICVLDLLAAGGAWGWNHVGKDQYQSITGEKKISLVAFVVPWTEPCKALEPEWLSATARSEHELISVDCTIEAELCRDKGVISYPTIRLSNVDGGMTRYRGSRKASGILSFLHRATLPKISYLDKKNVSDFKSIDDAVFVAYIPDGEGHMKSTFTSLAKRHSDKFAFGIITDKSVPRSEGLQFPSIVCYRTEEGEREVFTGQHGINALQKFMESATAPLIGEFTRRNEMKYMKAGKSLVYYFTSSDEDRASYMASIKPLATTYKEYLSFVTVDAAEYEHMITALGLQTGTVPALAVFNPMYGQMFPYQEGEITAQAVEKFVTDIASGKIQPLGEGASAGQGHTEL